MESLLVVVFLIISCASLAFSAGGDSWSYEGDTGPNHWKGVCETGKRQSPIDIKSSDAVYNALGKFDLKNYEKKLDLNFTVSNNGHGMVVSLTGSDYVVSGGGLVGSYKTIQFHLHWGANEDKGSEHVVNGESYPAEMHFVSCNTNYPNLTEALKYPDGLAVLGVFIEVEGDDDNDAWSFLDFAANVTKYNSSVVVPASDFAVFSKMLPASKNDYYRYNGSLTTPTCNEVVTWTVFNDAVKISKRQIDLLRKLEKQDGNPLTKNYRPPTPLNGRTVKASFNATSVATDTPPAHGSTAKPEPPKGGASVSRMTAGLFLSMLSVLFALQ